VLRLAVSQLASPSTATIFANSPVGKFSDESPNSQYTPLHAVSHASKAHPPAQPQRLCAGTREAPRSTLFTLVAASKREAANFRLRTQAATP
jgi:hypothetical protein